jgi:hypothetical protein
MPHINALSQAPPAVQFCAELKAQEAAVQRHEVAAGDLELLADGALEVRASSLTGRFSIAADALPDVAKTGGIPWSYFQDCDPELRSFSFNHRVRHAARHDQPAQLVLRNETIVSILNANLLPVPRAEILDTVLNAKPADVAMEDIRAIAPAWNEDFDVSLVVPARSRAPRPGDLVAFGVNVSEGRDGAVQVHVATFRCVCKNGATERICDSQHHRLRRPLNHPDRQRLFLNGVASFAREAWQHWQEHADALEELTRVSIDPNDRTLLRSRLSQRPFFLSKRLADQVIDRLQLEIAENQGEPSVFDLYNAMSYLATHTERLSQTYRTRLRLGAGELGRRKSRICEACRQLILDTPTT